MHTCRPPYCCNKHSAAPPGPLLSRGPSMKLPVQTLAIIDMSNNTSLISLSTTLCTLTLVALTTKQADDVITCKTSLPVKQADDVGNGLHHIPAQLPATQHHKKHEMQVHGIGLGHRSIWSCHQCAAKEGLWFLPAQRKPVALSHGDKNMRTQPCQWSKVLHPHACVAWRPNTGCM